MAGTDLHWFKFYPTDWLGTGTLRRASHATKGFYIDLLCVMFDCESRGRLEARGVAWTEDEICRSVNGDPSENLTYLRWLIQSGVLSKDESGVIYSRRMVKDEAKRIAGSEAGKKGGGNPKFQDPKFQSEMSNRRVTDQNRARKAVAAAIKRGDLPPLAEQKCANCDQTAQSYHHTHGYDKEHELTVTPLCNSCHGSLHYHAFGESSKGDPKVSTYLETRDQRPETRSQIPDTTDQSEDGESASDSDPSENVTELIVSEWNKIPGVTKAERITAKRRASLNARMREAYFRSNWQEGIARVGLSEFCQGSRNWRADIDWFLRPDTLVKILEGAYDNRQRGSPATAPKNLYGYSQGANIVKELPREQSTKTSTSGSGESDAGRDVPVDAGFDREAGP